MFLDLNTGQALADSAGCRGQDIPQPGFPPPLPHPLPVMQFKTPPPQSCPPPERSGHSEDLQNGSGSWGPRFLRIRAFLVYTFLWTRRWGEQMAYKHRSGQGSFFFFLPSSLASQALRAGGAVSSRQAHCPVHARKLDAAPPRETAVGTHTPASQAWQGEGGPEPQEKPRRRGQNTLFPGRRQALDSQTRPCSAPRAEGS